MELNEVKFNFKLVEVKSLSDISSTLYHFEHLISGGNVYYLKNDDTNCVFAIGFRTLPEDSTGVCHIIEHSLLCGSEKYPLKEPFVNLLKSSLSTFLNAFTAYDWTMFPFASQTPRDFDNILKIYCDAVFRPVSMIDPKPFLQEGWHLEMHNKDDIPFYKGVVYNEMKGAMSSVDERLVQTTLESMYKDTFYRFNSGGEPDVIPELSYEQYKDFYKRHYTPQNAMTYFYGDLDIEEKLEFLDKEYFSKYQKGEEIVIKAQEPFVNLDYEKDYEIGEEEDTKNNTYMSLCYGLDHYSNIEDLMGMRIVTDVLLGKNDAPLKKILLDAKLGENVEWRIDDDNIVPALHIYLQKTNHDKKAEFKKVFEDAVRKIVDEGIDKKLLLANINFSEFKDKECDMGRMPKGLAFAMNMMGSFNYHTDMTATLEFSKYYDKFRRELDNGYFEKLLEKYILNSKHNVEVVINPSKTLGQEKKKAMDAKMLELKNSMSEEDIDELLKLNEELLAYQNHIDTKEELATMPKLEIKDIPTTINYLDSKEIKLKNYKAISHNIQTNKICYTRMYFDLKNVSFEDLPYVYLLKSLYLNVPTKKHSSLELTSLIKTYLGDLSFGVVSLAKSRTESDLLFSVSSSALLENVNYIPEFINEVLLKTKFPRNEIKTILSQLVTMLRQDIIENGNGVAKLMAQAKYSIDSIYALKCMRGPLLYSFLNGLLKNFDYKAISTKLNEIAHNIFKEDNVLISISGDKEVQGALKKAMRKIKLYKEPSVKLLKVDFEEATKEALIIPSEVSYNAMCTNIALLDEKFKGCYTVLSHIVNYDYLWPEVRVKGGAYGCSLGINRIGDVYFTTFRDPNVTSSYDTFKKLPEYLRKFKVSKEEFDNYIIGAMGGFDSPLSTPMFIDSGDVCYLKHYTKQDKKAFKKEVLRTKQKDIRDASKLFEMVALNSSEFTIGNETEIRKYPFDTIKSL